MGGGEHFPIDPYSGQLPSEPHKVTYNDNDDLHQDRERVHEHERVRVSAREREWDHESEGELEGERESDGELEGMRRGSVIKGELVKVYSKANPLFSLTAELDTVVLNKAEDYDTTQLWYKYDLSGGKVKDSEGHSAFVLVNKASHLALKHDADDSEQVTLATVREDDADISLLWTLSDDVGNGYKAIRPVTDTKLNLDADHADKEHGGVREHNRLILYKWKKQDNQKWMLHPLID